MMVLVWVWLSVTVQFGLFWTRRVGDCGCGDYLQVGDYVKKEASQCEYNLDQFSVMVKQPKSTRRPNCG